MIKTIIIDDEPQARKVVSNLLQTEFAGVEIVAEGDDLNTGIAAIEAHQPDLVFLDIQLGSGTGFDLLTQVGGTDFEVIFVTAYDQYALTAFQFSAFGYLLKPVRISELRRVMDKFESQMMLKEKARSERLKILVESYEDQGKVQKLVVQHMHGFQVLPLPEIVYLRAEGNYTWFTLLDNEQILISKTLKDYEQLLTDFGFYRIHQTYLVNLRHVKQYRKGDGGSVVMVNQDELTVSRRKKNGFLKLFLG